jgi:hypothetical protein
LTTAERRRAKPHLSFLALVEDVQSFDETERRGGHFAAKSSPTSKSLCLRCVFQFNVAANDAVVSTRASLLAADVYDGRYMTIQCPLPLAATTGGGDTTRNRLSGDTNSISQQESPFSVTLRGCRPHLLLQSAPMRVCVVDRAVATPPTATKTASAGTADVASNATKSSTTVAICLSKPLSLRHTHSQTAHTKLDYVKAWVKFHLLLGAAHVYISDR